MANTSGICMFAQCSTASFAHRHRVSWPRNQRDTPPFEYRIKALSLLKVNPFELILVNLSYYFFLSAITIMALLTVRAGHFIAKDDIFTIGLDFLDPVNAGFRSGKYLIFTWLFSTSSSASYIS